ncbi:MAG: hypothetical protein IJT75_07280 [Bacteroidaceae bacterium]|nr:hypothetical protein [Bacteroidaceae bacterium]
METNQTKMSNDTTPLSPWRGDGGEASLIAEVFQRRALLSDLDRLIIAEVRREARRTWLRRWGRAVVFSFGLPLVLLFFASRAYLYIIEHGTMAFNLIVMALPTLALIFTTQRALATFSPDEV